jgi:hypothetical protein
MTQSVNWPCDSPDWLNEQLVVTSAAVRGSRLFNSMPSQATPGFSNVPARLSTGESGSPPVRLGGFIRNRQETTPFDDKHEADWLRPLLSPGF